MTPTCWLPGQCAHHRRPRRSREPDVRDGKVLINATLNSAADSLEAEEAVKALRTDVRDVDSGALVGGVTATALDTNTTAQRDLVIIIPVVLVVILFILMLLLRSVVAPVLLVLSVVLSYAAAMGVSALVFNNIFGLLRAPTPRCRCSGSCSWWPWAWTTTSS